MQQLTFDNLRYEIIDHGAWITIHRPDKLNALNRATVEEIDRAVGAALANPSVRAIAITGSGDRAFVAGADIAEMCALGPAEAQEFSKSLHAVFDRIERANKPIVAAVNGFALGGGCELALACHLRWASTNARFGQPEINLGLIPGAGGTQRLPRIIGRGRALEWILGGEMIDAVAAERLGLVNQVVLPEQLKEAVAKQIAQWSGKSQLTLSRALDAVIAGASMPQDEALCFEAALFGLCFATADMKEGTAAFLEKRKPSFRGL